MHNKDKTIMKLIEAVDRILERDGFGSLGINAIAREASVSKILIYRYFGGLEGLLHAYGESRDFWPAQQSEMKEIYEDQIEKGIEVVASEFMKHFLRELRKRPATQEVLRWELSHNNKITEDFASTREKQGLEMMKIFENEKGLDDGVDINALAAIISAGISFLLLRSKTAPVFLGIPLREVKGWERIETTIESIMNKVLKKEK